MLQVQIPKDEFVTRGWSGGSGGGEWQRHCRCRHYEGCLRRVLVLVLVLMMDRWYVVLLLLLLVVVVW